MCKVVTVSSLQPAALTWQRPGGAERWKHFVKEMDAVNSKVLLNMMLFLVQHSCLLL